MPGQHGVGRDDAEFLLSRKHLLAVGVPAVVELSRVLVGPSLGDLMRRMVGAGREVQEERFVGSSLLEVGDETNRPVGQILAEVIALLRRLRRLDLVVDVHQVRVVLVGIAPEKAVVTLETTSERPAVIRARGADLLGRGQVPLAHAIGRVAVLEQHFRQEPVLERDCAVRAGETCRPLGDARHRIRMVVAASEHARTRR
jgi:hypothetical protein